MDAASRRTKGVRLTLIVPLMLLVAGALAWTGYKKRESADMSKNFVLNYSTPAGWKAAAHGPETLFRCIDPKTDLVLRGAVNQVISEDNPTPELDTKGIADYYVDRTENMGGWKVQRLGVAKGDGTSFEVLRRSARDRVVVTAYAVKGNTTVLVTLFGKGKARNLVDPNIGVLDSFLRTVSLHEKDMSDL
jgi:hypothetical protein